MSLTSISTYTGTRKMVNYTCAGCPAIPFFLFFLFFPFFKIFLFIPFFGENFLFFPFFFTFVAPKFFLPLFFPQLWLKNVNFRDFFMYSEKKIACGAVLSIYQSLSFISTSIASIPLFMNYLVSRWWSGLGSSSLWMTKNVFLRLLSSCQ